ncbi:MAG: InlB B-repeat-containing protein [Erysipelotrichaceae bacterium]
MKIISRLIIVFIFVFLFKVINTQAFSGDGSGTTLDPYIITNADELVEMNDDLEAAYVLANDIDMTDVEWEPIGVYYDPFYGVLNGAGYSILNLSASTVAIDYDFTEAYTMAMFGVIDGEAQIYNLGLNINYEYDSTQSGEDIFVAGLVAFVEDADVSIHDIWVSGTIDVTTPFGNEFASIGGVIGEAFNQNLTGLSFSGDITVDINNVLSVDFGGIIGYAGDTSLRASTVYDSTLNHNSEAEDDANVGGLIGYTEVNNPWLHEGGYAMIGQSLVDNVEINTIGYDSVGGLAGYASNDAYDISDSFVDNWIEENWVKDSIITDGRSNTGGLVGEAYGIFIRYNQVDSVTIGSVEDNRGQLGGLIGYGFELIMDYNRIIDISISAGAYSYAIGGLVGNLEKGSINHTYVTGNLQSNYQDVGGIVGEAGVIDISNTYFSGTLSGLNYVGGLVGVSSGILQIYSSWTDGDFTASNSDVGGLIGYFGGDESIINNSYSLATISGVDNAGGLIGEIYASFTALELCYFGGTVTADNNFNALIGYYTGDSLSTDYLYYDEVNEYTEWGTAVPAADLKSVTSDVGVDFHANEFANPVYMSAWFVSPLINDGYLGVWAGRNIVTFYDQDVLIGLQLTWGEMISDEGVNLNRISLYYRNNLNPNFNYSIYWGIKAAKPSDPKTTGYVFGGWYTDEELTSLWDFKESSEGDMTLYAKWTAAIPDTGDIAGLSNALLGLGGLLIMATKRRRI